MKVYRRPERNACALVTAHRHQYPLLLAVITVLFTCGTSHTCAQSSLLVRAEIDGVPSSLFEKVIVTSSKAVLKDSPTGEGAFMPPYSIFYKLMTDSGEPEQAGHFRVGTQEGKHLGWIDKQYLAEWNTRFVLEPMQPTKTRFFKITLDEQSQTVAELKHIPVGKTRYAFITQAAENVAEENGPFPVVVCTAAVNSGGESFTDELNDLQALQLEIVLVLEYTDAMTYEFDGKPLIQYVREMGQQFAATVTAAQNNPARFGIVIYQDTNTGASIKLPEVILPLTADTEAFVKALDHLEPTEIGGDWPEDAISALNKALTQAGWTQNSTKHIVHLTYGSFQLYGKGEGPNILGLNDRVNSISKFWDRTNLELYPDSLGYNSSGVSLSQLSSMAAPQGGNIELRLRNRKTFHGVWVGKPLEEEINELNKDKEDDEEKVTLKKILKLYETLETHLFDESDEDKVGVCLQELQAHGVSIQDILTIVNIVIKEDDERLAQQQLRELTNNLGTPGYYNVMRPTAESVRSVAADLQSQIAEAITAMAKIRKGEIDDAEQIDTDNKITERYYQIVGAAKEKFSGEEIVEGLAFPRDAKGRLVAVKKVLVTEVDLKRLESTFDALHKTFQAKVSKVDRQDVTTILEGLQEAIAGAASGQTELELTESSQLKSLITSLPLRTNALDITPGDIAIMSSDAFTTWLETLDVSTDRIRDLLGSGTEWMTLNEFAENDRFTFLRLSELP